MLTSLASSSPSPTVSEDPSSTSTFRSYASPRLYHQHPPAINTRPGSQVQPSTPPRTTSSSTSTVTSTADPNQRRTSLSQSPTAALARSHISSPRSRARHSSIANTTDAGTQYTPPDYPPTSSNTSVAPSSTATSTSRPAHTSQASATARITTAATTTPTKRRAEDLPHTVPSAAGAAHGGATAGGDGIAGAGTATAEGGRSGEAERGATATAGGVEDTRNGGLATAFQSQPSQQMAGTGGEEHQPGAAVVPSPAKRHKPTTPEQRAAASQQPGIKIMPLAYETCDVKDLGTLIADMLMELVRLNDAIPLKDGGLTRFHSRAPPSISVHDYLARLIVHATLSPPLLLAMVYYVDRLCALYPAFTISSLTVHRFLITAATVAAKGLSDAFWTNSTYARVGGVSTRELGLLELEFLRRLEWRIVPRPEVLVDYYRGLVERGAARGFRLEGSHLVGG